MGGGSQGFEAISFGCQYGQQSRTIGFGEAAGSIPQLQLPGAVNAATTHGLHGHKFHPLLSEPALHHWLLHGESRLTPALEALPACRHVEPL